MEEDVVTRFSNKLQELSNAEAAKSTLMELKSLVLNSEKQILIQIIQNCSLRPIFPCLNSTDYEEVEMSCTIIYNLLKHMNANDCFSHYSDFLERALSHPSSSIKTMILNVLNDMVDEENIKKIAVEHPGILIEAANSIGSMERSVAQGAIQFFSSIGQSQGGLDILYSGMLLEKFREVMIVTDIARFRVYEIVSYVSQKSEQGLKASKASGLLDLLLGEVKSSDTLLQLNALEILSTLGSSSHGYNYLQESGLIQYLTDKLLKLDDEPMSFVLLPGLIEFFGNICKEVPHDFIRVHPEVIDLLFRSLDTNDEVLLGVIFSSVGKVGSTVNGKLALNNKEQHMETFFKKASNLLSLKNDATVSVLHSLAELFTVQNGSNTELSAMLLTWFNHLGPDTLDKVVSLTKLPFIELRLSALTFLNAIASHPWGAEKITRYPGMTEYLTDRSTEIHKDCKSAKYDIVLAITRSSNVHQILDSETFSRLKEFVKEGPYYVPTMSPEMMTEGAS